MKVSVTVNGRSREAETEPRTTLLDFLRDNLGLTGTHMGCEHGVCGACSVLFDGQPVRAVVPTSLSLTATSAPETGFP